MKIVNIEFETLQDYSTNQLVYFCVKASKRKFDVPRLIWDVCLSKGRSAYPKETSYNAANLFLKSRKLDNQKIVETLTDYFWQVLKH